MLLTIRLEAKSLEPVSTPSMPQSNKEIHETSKIRAISPSTLCCDLLETNIIASKNILENSKVVSAKTSPSEMSLMKEMSLPHVSLGPLVSLIIMF
ncbi:LOW QUALITY PROTEIN: hypothetical protein PanWU01x14_339890 [Parasponia andersonii]|uniref:Uncharacterized protein n=1 Tax=Parasponia andersonii TaxID=3476 RepID=A0A2P5AEL3_PARAD|nr:LOW QUALITY PROTEIN: hypothetical protein PanWU01x14_339890 [Parasponia andersonii]